MAVDKVGGIMTRRMAKIITSHPDIEHWITDKEEGDDNQQCCFDVIVAMIFDQNERFHNSCKISFY